MKIARISLALAGLMLLMSTAAVAQVIGEPKVLNGNGSGRLYHVTKANPPRVQSNEVPLPMPVDPPLPESLGGATQLGRSFESTGFSMLSPRGGAMMTPKQRADRDVQKLIKRLG